MCGSDPQKPVLPSGVQEHLGSERGTSQLPEQLKGHSLRGKMETERGLGKEKSACLFWWKASATAEVSAAAIAAAGVPKVAAHAAADAVAARATVVGAAVAAETAAVELAAAALAAALAAIWTRTTMMMMTSLRTIQGSQRCRLWLA